MNTVEIKFDENRNVYVRLNFGEWLVENWEDLTKIEKILIRTLVNRLETTVVTDEMLFIN